MLEAAVEIGVSDDITSLKVQVHGFVQGVGFRDFLMMSAQAQKLDGWVRNRSDGSVEALVSGSTKAVEIFVSHATQGPPGAKVTAVDLHNSDPPPERGFKRRPSL
jgi:acylphosphatase